MGEKERVLEMVKNGKISIEEAEKLLDAIYTTKERKIVKQVGVKSDPKELKGKLVIKVNSKDGDNVNVNLPLKVASIAAKFIPQNKMDVMEAEGVNLNSILENIDELIEAVDEDIVNVESADGDNVRIYIEK